MAFYYGRHAKYGKAQAFVDRPMTEKSSLSQNNLDGQKYIYNY